KEYPDEATGHYWLGRALRSLNKPEEALAALKTASEISPDWEDPFDHVCSVLFNLKRYDDALEFARTRLEENPKFRVAWFYRGACEALKGNKRGAYESWNKAFELDPDYERVLMYLVDAAFDVGEYRDSMFAASRYTLRHPDELAGWMKLGRA